MQISSLSTDRDFKPVGTVVKQEPEGSKNEVLEGAEITVYVCSGYKFDLEVDLPMDLAQTVGTYNISLFADGAMIDKGNTVDGAVLSSYTFKDIVTKNEKISLVVKVSAGGKSYNYCEYTVNNTTGKVSAPEYYSDYQALIDNYNSSNSSSDVSSDN